MASNKIFVITGPSAVGKTTIAKALLKSDLPLARVITTTTRDQRSDEVQGKDYHFISKPKFQQLIDDGLMLEWAVYDDNYYGSQKRDVNAIFATGRYPLWIVDVQGAEYLKHHYPEVRVIFIMPSAFNILRERLERRGGPESEIRARLKISRAELLKAPLFDYRVINYDGELEKVVKTTADLITKIIATG